MAGEVGELLIKALVVQLRIAYAADESTKRVDVQYAAVGEPERERVYGGGSRSDLDYAAYASGVPRAPREEGGTVDMTIDVIRAGWTVEEADDRARKLYVVLENVVAGFLVWNTRAPVPPVPLMSWCRVAAIERDYFALDGAVWSTRGVTIAYKARLH